MKQKILETLKIDTRLWIEEELNQTLLIDLVEKYDINIINLLFNDEDLKNSFFINVGKSWVFNVHYFVFFMEENKVNNSFTDYQNRIGLTAGKRFLKDTNDVVLNFPFRDCVLQGGQSTDEGVDNFYQYDEKVGVKDKKLGHKAGEYNLKKSKRKEVFFNQILAKDEIDRLKDPKALVNWKRFDKGGEQEVGGIKRDESGLIKENLIIKGNNYLALNSLTQQFTGKVKLVYIDPPYNTGSDSFNYNDNFNHSTWLTFMKNRLEIARELLSDDGVIFVQCDDNEQAYLKVLMDEIFGRVNFISTSTVIINRGGKDYGGIAKTHEYLLVYSKNECELNQLEDKNKKFKFTDSRGGFNLMELRNRNVLFNAKNRSNLCYPFYINPKNKDENNLLEISLEKKEGYIELMPLKSQGVQTVWRWGKEKAFMNLNLEIKGKDKKDGGYMIVQKYRKLTKRQRSVWDDKEFANQKGTDHIKLLFNNKAFPYPKSEFLLRRMIELSTKKGDLVLDYHLGSGTTCAVAHKMGRQYIGIEQMDYIEDIAVKRMQKVIESEQGGVSDTLAWQGGGEFVYVELAKWNDTAKEKIIQCQNLEALIILFDEMYQLYFLNYNLKIKEFKEKVIKEDNFKKLALDKQKAMFLTMLDLNQMSVNKSEMADSKYNLNKQDQLYTQEFYGDK